jgi:two-component system sensor histidine kinase KdpD
MRSELISAVSHELRTPLGFIKGYATTLLRDDTPIETPTQRHFLEIIDEETDKLEHMIDELLDASRLQAGRLAIEPEPVSLRKLVSRSVEKVRPALEGDGHAVTLRLPDEDVDVLVDPLRIEQVIDNLLENAGRYSDPSSPVDIDVVAENGHALVSVSDRGDEISPTDLEQIFEPFYRGRNAARHGIRGAGLGLAICRGIIEAHGGRIWAESGHGERNTFLLTLPITSGQVAG